MSRRKKYTKDYKLGCLEYWENSNKTSEEVGKELGIRADQLRHWRTEFSRTNGYQNDLDEKDLEIIRLKKEMAELKEDNEILKKAAAIFSRLKQ